MILIIKRNLVIALILIKLSIFVESIAYNNNSNNNNNNNRTHQNFIKQIHALNQNLNKDLNDLYFCSSHINHTSPIKWILRNKKCISLVDRELDYSHSFKNCADIPFAYTRLMHKNEFVSLQNQGIDFFKLYSSLDKNRSKISIWLIDTEFTDHSCLNRTFAPIVQFDDFKCKNGCFDCASRKDSSAYFVCVKSCDWKVPFDSYCNTMRVGDFELGSNLYFQDNKQIYVCQGDLKCIDFKCKCELRKRLFNRKKCVL